MSKKFGSASLYLGKLFGVKFTIHISVLLLFALLFRANSAKELLWIFLSIVFSLLFHNLGHIAASKFFNSRVAEINIDAVGGSVSFGYYDDSPKAKICGALGGIIASLLLGVASYRYFSPLSTINFTLAFLNCIPASPLDGGEILRSVLLLVYGKQKSTLVSRKVAFISAIFLVLATFLGISFFENVSSILLIYIAYLIFLDAMKTLGKSSDNDIADDVVIVSPPPYGSEEETAKIHRER